MFRTMLCEYPSINWQLNLFYPRATVAAQSTFYVHLAIDIQISLAKVLYHFNQHSDMYSRYIHCGGAFILSH
jgi:hypothetical protein